MGYTHAVVNCKDGDRETFSDYHHVIGDVTVYLHANRDGTGWEICDHVVDGEPLPTNDAGLPTTEGCGCLEAECEQCRRRLEAAGMPTGQELARMLIEKFVAPRDLRMLRWGEDPAGRQLHGAIRAAEVNRAAQRLLSALGY